MNLAPGASAQLRTYEGHLFHATSVTDSSKILSSVSHTYSKTYSLNNARAPGYHITEST